jgi:hypothetical protein
MSFASVCPHAEFLQVRTALADICGSALRMLSWCREGDNEYRCLGAGMRAKQILMIKAQVRHSRRMKQ